MRRQLTVTRHALHSGQTKEKNPKKEGNKCSSLTEAATASPGHPKTAAESSGTNWQHVIVDTFGTATAKQSAFTDRGLGSCCRLPHSIECVDHAASEENEENAVCPPTTTTFILGSPKGDSRGNENAERLAGSTFWPSCRLLARTPSVRTRSLRH